MLEKASASSLHAYVVVSLLTGIRTEEARALRWDHVVAWVDDDDRWQPVTEAGFDHDRLAIYVWRSVREDGDTKTEKSRRTLELPDQAATPSGRCTSTPGGPPARGRPAWRDHGLVFCTRVGTPLLPATSGDPSGRSPKRPGSVKDWTPRELRHSFVSIMSDNGVPIETIADLVGHKNTTVTEPGSTGTSSGP